MRVTLVQFAPQLSRVNFQTIVEIINEKQGESDLIVFPELALNGYLLQDKLSEDAWEINELNQLALLSLSVDIVLGAAIKEADIFRNAALYFHKGTLMGHHHKVHLPNYGMFEEARYFKAGTHFKSFMVEDRKISMLVCEDLWHKSVHEELIKENPDRIIVLVASPARGFKDGELEIQEKWYAIIQQVALECSATLLFVNRVGFEDGLGFWGGSCCVSSDGIITNKLPLFETKIESFEI